MVSFRSWFRTYFWHIFDLFTSVRFFILWITLALYGIAIYLTTLCISVMLFLLYNHHLFQISNKDLFNHLICWQWSTEVITSPYNTKWNFYMKQYELSQEQASGYICKVAYFVYRLWSEAAKCGIISVNVFKWRF